MRLVPFDMERYQSTYEHRVRINLSESGVEPLTAGELLTLAAGATQTDELDLQRSLLGTGLGYGQSNGSDELRESIARLYAGATEASVLVTVGGAEANFACFWHLAEREGRAAAIVPTYGQVPGLVDSFAGRLTPVPLVEEEGWQPDLTALRKALAAGARFLLITNPNNPTGSALSSEAMREIVSLTDRYGAWILADEVYGGAETGANSPGRDLGRPLPGTPSFWGCHDRVLVTGSLSKAYGLPGLRVGWVVGPTALVSELWGRTDYTTIAPATLSDRLASFALHPEVRPLVIERTRKIVASNLVVVRNWALAQGDRFGYRPPDAGAICYLRYDAPVNSTEFAEKLRVDKSLLVVPGDHFGMDGYLRIGFGNPVAELREGLALVRDAFDELALAS